MSRSSARIAKRCSERERNDRHRCCCCSQTAWRARGSETAARQTVDRRCRAAPNSSAAPAHVLHALRWPQSRRAMSIGADRCHRYQDWEQVGRARTAPRAGACAGLRPSAPPHALAQGASPTSGCTSAAPREERRWCRLWRFPILLGSRMRPLHDMVIHARHYACYAVASTCAQDCTWIRWHVPTCDAPCNSKIFRRQDQRRPESTPPPRRLHPPVARSRPSRGF